MKRYNVNILRHLVLSEWVYHIILSLPRLFCVDNMATSRSTLQWTVTRRMFVSDWRSGILFHQWSETCTARLTCVQHSVPLQAYQSNLVEINRLRVKTRAGGDVFLDLIPVYRISAAWFQRSYYTLLSRGLRGVDRLQEKYLFWSLNILFTFLQ